MLAGLYLCLYQAAGLLVVRWLLPKKSPVVRAWMGSTLGLLLLMWFPALCAMAFGFTKTAHLAALLPLVLTVAAGFLGRDRTPVSGWDAAETRLLRQLLLVALPLTILGGYLQYTHNVRVADDGAWHVGQSTYGDLPMHLSIITGLKNHPFPPDYPFCSGQQLSYPFLMDTLSTTLYLFGWSLQASTVVPGTWMMALLYSAVLILGREMTGSRKAAVLATLLFFLNGGLGFLYDFDQAAGYEWDGSLTVLSRLNNILTGYYKTPTNQPDPNNLRWSNLIADLLIPQRTLLGGYCMVLPCIELLWDWRGHAETGEHTRETLLLGIWGGMLPMIHTHSFLALALMSLGRMVYDLIHIQERKRVLLQYAGYGLLAALISVPQLVLFTFRQVFQGGEHASFLTFQFNWVNNPGGNGMRDFYFWFYLKNIGLPLLLVLGAALERRPTWRAVYAMALPVILAAELIRFQPNEYDNNKLFYLAWLLLCMPAADYAAVIWRRMKGLRVRPLLGVVVCIVLFLSSGLTLWRECVSDYVAFDRASVEAGEYVRDETPEDAVFLTGTQHLNPVISIGGRHIVCGPDLWLYWHGIDTTERKWDIARFLADPETNTDVLDRYGVTYVMISSFERQDYTVDETGLRMLFEPVFENASVCIYRRKE